MIYKVVFQCQTFAEMIIEFRGDYGSVHSAALEFAEKNGY